MSENRFQCSSLSVSLHTRLSSPSVRQSEDPPPRQPQLPLPLQPPQRLLRQPSPCPMTLATPTTGR